MANVANGPEDEKKGAAFIVDLIFNQGPGGMRRHLQEDHLRPDVPAGVVDLLVRCLAPNPAHRPTPPHALQAIEAAFEEEDEDDEDEDDEDEDDVEVPQ